VRESPSEKQTVAPKFTLSFYRARYYDPSTGEFISRDPLEYVDGMSLYRGYFVPNVVDPLGMSRWLQDGVGRWESEILPQHNRCPKEECKVISFNVKTTGSMQIFARGVGIEYTIDAVFDEPCDCCEYRQYIVGKPKHRSRTWIPGREEPGPWRENPDKDLPPGPGGLREDCVFNVKTKSWDCYGRKDKEGTIGDYYSHGECLYHAKDFPGTYGVDETMKKLPVGWVMEYEVDIKFVHRIIDVCNKDKVVSEIKTHAFDSIKVSEEDFLP